MLALTAVGAVGALTLVLTSLLVLANKWLHVEEDPRIDAVEDMLPHANCGACGLPGCRPFAEALVGGQTQPGQCTVSTDEGRGLILVRGAVPGAKGGWVLISDAVKHAVPDDAPRPAGESQ